MSLLKSLICFKGFDNGLRYLWITGCCYLLMIILSSVLAKAIILLILLLLVSLPILSATAIRRIRDAHLALPIAFATPLMFLICVLSISFAQTAAIWFLLLPAFLISLATGFLNNPKVRKQNTDYVLGYSGPIDLSNKSVNIQKHHSFHGRIEPTLVANSLQDTTKNDDQFNRESFNAEISQPHLEQNNTFSSSDNYNAESTNNTTASNWQNAFNEWLLNNTKIKVLIILSIIIIISIVTSFIITPDPSDAPIEKPIIEEAVKQRLNKIEMPDNFWVMHDEHDAITIGWQGDIRQDGEIWSAKTALGDESCTEISFSRNEKFRSLKVIIKNQGDYYADFSPIDTQAIVQAIALKSKFNLCGYEFSLKGTQAKLMNNKKYSSYFEE